MLDQLFSSTNFQYIFDKKNRKGVYLESIYFSDVKNISEEIKDLNTQKKKYLQLSKKDMGRHLCLKYIYHRKMLLEGQKKDLLHQHLTNIAKRVSNQEINLALTFTTINSKKIYTFLDKKDPALFFLNKQINNNLKYNLLLKQSNRNLIIPQVRSLLSNSFPKIIVKADISSFYESINRRILLKKLSNEPQLSYLTKKYIVNILKEFGKISLTSSSHIGIPRGLPICAYLAELYMKKLDNYFMNHSQCSYYARYVDDIFIIFHPSSFSKEISYTEVLQDELKKLDLHLNFEKTREYKVIHSNQEDFNFTFLGYGFHLKANGKKRILTVDISEKKYERYRKKILISFIHYHRKKNRYPLKSANLLYDRIKFLIHNFHLKNNKGNVLTGMHFTNKYIKGNSIRLSQLDHELHMLIAFNNIPLGVSKIPNTYNLSFVQSFKNKSYISLPRKKRLAEITKIWRDI